MAKKNVYLMGGMTGLSFEEANTWRVQIQDRLDDIDGDISVFNPLDHFSFKDVEDGIITDKEAMEIDLHKLRNSDFAFMNFNAPHSLGSQAELAIAYDRRIPVLGINIGNKELHPWQTAMVHKMFLGIDEAVLYAVDHLIYDD